jgi:hypothetical protein
MSDFTAEKSENRRYLRFSVEPPHIGGGWVGVDVSFVTFLCAKEKRLKSLFLYKEKSRIKDGIPTLFHKPFRRTGGTADTNGL